MKRLLHTLRGNKKEKTEDHNSNSEEEEEDEKIHHLLPPEIMLLIFSTISEKEGVIRLGMVRMVCVRWNELCLDEALPFYNLFKKKKEEVGISTRQLHPFCSGG